MVPLDIAYLGEWKTPFWVGDENRGDMRRIGFEARARINRHDFGVSWQDELPGGGLVVSNEIELILDVEAILLEDLERTGAIDYYRPSKADANYQVGRKPRRSRRATAEGYGVQLGSSHPPPPGRRPSSSMSVSISGGL